MDGYLQAHWHRGYEVYWRMTAPTWREALERASYSRDATGERPYLRAPAGFKPFIWKDKFGFWFVGIRREQ